MSDNPSYKVRFMPWAGLTEELSIGPVRLRPWTPDIIRDKAIADYLTRYFRCHVDHRGVPVDSITLVNVGDEEFAPLSEQEAQKTRSAVDALIFATICPSVNAAVSNDNLTMNPPTADRYQLISQAFQPGVDSVTVRCGSNLTVCRVEETCFSRPWGLGGPFGFPDAELLAGLGTLISSDDLAKPRERILRSLEWFRLAHTHGDNASELTKLVLKCTSFETLFALDENEGKTKQFIEAVEQGIASKNRSRASRADYRGKSRNYSLPGWWAHDFYNLRSRIVHGDEIDHAALRYAHWITHGIVADLVYWQCLVDKLYKLKCLGDSIREHAKNWDAAFPDEKPGTAEPLLKEWFLGSKFEPYQQVLGWLPKST